ncbi:MAG: DUF1622 domain-containing protein [Dehalococcoidia bacterium]
MIGHLPGQLPALSLAFAPATYVVPGHGSPASIQSVLGLPANFTQDTINSTVLRTFIFLANLAGGIVVGVATMRGLATFAIDLIRDWGGDVPKEAIRLSLGRSLSLALEFQVGADILGTALNPTLRDIATLAAVVVLRTVLNFFLGRELEEAAQRQGAMPSQRADAPTGKGTP